MALMVREASTDALERELVAQARGARWSLSRLEREYIMSVLNEMGGHRGRTAAILGIDRRTLYRKLREFGVRSARRTRQSHEPVNERDETARSNGIRWA